jgi:hypothetical protein
MYANSKILKSNRNKKCTDMFLHCSLTHCDLIFLLQQNTRDWVVYKQQKFISHSSRGWKSEVEVEVEHGQVLVPSWVADGRFVMISAHGRKTVLNLFIHFTGAWIPIKRAPLSGCNYLLTAHDQCHHIGDLGFSTWMLGESTFSFQQLDSIIICWIIPLADARSSRRGTDLGS